MIHHSACIRGKNTARFYALIALTGISLDFGRMNATSGICTKLEKSQNEPNQDRKTCLNIWKKNMWNGRDSGEINEMADKEI
jgi:hypothetical protein